MNSHEQSHEDDEQQEVHQPDAKEAQDTSQSEEMQMQETHDEVEVEEEEVEEALPQGPNAEDYPEDVEIVPAGDIRRDASLMVRRFDAGHLENLADNLASLPPLTVARSEDERLDGQLLDGRHRDRGMEQAGWPMRPVRYEKVKDMKDFVGRASTHNITYGLPMAVADRKKVAFRLHDLGLSPEQIAPKVGRAVSTVYAWLQPVRQEEKTKRDARIRQLHHQGWSHEAIGEAVGLTGPSVSRVIQEGPPDQAEEEDSDDEERRQKRVAQRIRSDAGDLEEAIKVNPADEAPEGIRKAIQEGLVQLLRAAAESGYELPQELPPEEGNS